MGDLVPFEREAIFAYIRRIEQCINEDPAAAAELLATPEGRTRWAELSARMDALLGDSHTLEHP